MEHKTMMELLCKSLGFARLLQAGFASGHCGQLLWQSADHSHTRTRLKGRHLHFQLHGVPDTLLAPLSSCRPAQGATGAAGTYSWWHDISSHPVTCGSQGRRCIRQQDQEQRQEAWWHSGTVAFTINLMESDSTEGVCQGMNQQQ
jgi:hypothetical protein